MKFNRKSAVAAVLATGLVLSACGGGSSSGSNGSSGSKDASGKKLTFWVMKGTNPDSSAFYKKAKKAFKKETGATVKIQEIDWANAHKKFVTSFAGDTGPDVAEIGTTWTPEFAAVGGLDDITKKVESTKEYDSLLPALKDSASYKGKMYGVGWYAGVRSVIYRKDVYKELGLKKPKTWKQLQKNVQTIAKKKPKMYAMPIPGSSEYATDSFIWDTGGKLAEKKNGKWKGTVNSAKAREGLKYYANLSLKHDSSTTGASTWREDDLLDSFSKGKAAMAIEGNWTPKTVLQKNSKLKGKIGAFELPGKKGGMAPVFTGGSNMSVMKQSKHKDLAWKFVKLMTTGKLAQKWADDTNYFPSSKKLIKPYAKSKDPLVAPFARQMADAGHNVPNAPQWGTVEGKKLLTQMMQDILEGKSIDKATDKAASQITKTLNKKN